MIKRFIPNGLTLANLACGLLAIPAVLRGDFDIAAYFVCASLVFDFLDGFMARLLRVQSEIGKQLDSLADLVTFGVVPGFVMYQLISDTESAAYISYLGFLIPLFSALRLAKFNIDERQATYFIGMPTPSNAMFIFSIALISAYVSDNFLIAITQSPLFLGLICIVSSVWLILEIPLFSLKVKNLNWRDNKGIWSLLAGIIILFTFLGFQGLVFVIPLYLLISMVFKPKEG